MITVNRRLPIALALCLLGAGLLAGCGGGDGTASGQSASAAAKARFIEQADAICKKADEAQAAAVRRALGRAKKNRGQLEDEHIVLTYALPPVQKEAEELAALEPPPGDEKRIASIVKGIEKGLFFAEVDPTALLSGYNATLNAVDQIAAAYGFEVCSSSFDGSEPLDALLAAAKRRWERDVAE